jgi:parallel beta-helix repeat protein
VGTVVSLTATPGSGWFFGSWSGDLTGSTNPASITMDTAKSVTATFTQIPAADYYVDNTNPSCSDSGPGTQATPLCTMGRAAILAVAGDTVRVLAGTYAETVKPNSGTAGNPVTFSAAPGVTVTGLVGNSTNGGAFRLSTKSYIVIDGFNVTGTADYGIYVSGSDHITIQNNHVSSAGTPGSYYRMGIYIYSTTDSIISGNTSDHNSSDGIRLINGANNNIVSNNISFGNASEIQRDACGIHLASNSNNNTILHNITYGNEDTGLNFYSGSSNNLVIGNVTYSNGDHGIDNNAAPNNVFIGNTVYGNVTVGINLEGVASPGSGGATLINNISVDNGLRRQDDGSTSTGSPGNIRVDAQSLVGTTLDYNQIYLSTGTIQIEWNNMGYTSLSAFQAAVPGQETHGLQANPLFAAPAPIAVRPHTAPYNVAINLGDYHLTAGSPAIDSANSDAPNQPLTDIENNPRVDDPTVANSGTGTRTYDDRGAYEFQPAGQSVYSIPLVTGWNLISFNVHPDNTDITSVLSSIDGNYDLVYAWDATGAHSGAGNWMRYAPGIPGNTLSTLDETQGFWIRMTTADTLDIVGSAPTTTNISLLTTASGWNLVGYPSDENRSMPDALTTHGVTAYTLVYAYHANDTSVPWDPWKRYATGVPGNDLLELVPGWGYWIKITATSTWQLDY